MPKKVDFLFPTVKKSQRAKLLLDDVALYSVTDQRTADAISRRLMRFVPSSATVTNATACVGGNTWSFAKHFAKVVAIEKDPTRFKYLVHNMEVLGARNVESHNDDALHKLFDSGEKMQRKPSLDMVFFDPPWGGPEYKNKEKISLSLSDVPLSQVLNKLSPVAKFIALKVPVNFDSDKLVRDCTDSLSLVLLDKFKKMHLLVFRSTSPSVWA